MKTLAYDKPNQNTITEAAWGKWKEAEIMAGEAIDAIKRFKLLSGKDVFMRGSISVAQSAMKENLIDEYHIQLCAVLTGGGRNLLLEGIDFGQLTF